MKALHRTLLLPAAVLLAALSAHAQLGTANLTGRVTDPTGSAIPNATVVLESTLQQYTRSVTTDSAGEYVIPSIPPGSYKLNVQAPGFSPESRTGIDLSSGQASTLNVPMRVGETTEQVTVSEAPPLLQTTTATLGTVIGAKQVTDLPLLGRSFLSLILLSPGAAPVPPAGSTTTYNQTGENLQPSMYGQRQKDNNYTLDGVENRDPNLLGVPLFPPPEAIAEMKVESGMSSAVYGHGSGATVNVVTKPGTNQWHGDLWEFLRNNKLDARSFFLPTLGAFRWNQFGAAAGGPLTIPKLLRKEKGWYVFGYYEGLRIRRASNSRSLVPTPGEIDGDFRGSATIFDPFSTVTAPNGTSARQPFPDNRIPSPRLNAPSRTLAKALYPVPNLPAGQIPGVNFINTDPVSQDSDQWSGRVDHQFSQKDSFYARYSEARSPTRSVGLPALPSETLARVTNVAISESHVFSPTFLVTGRFGMARSNTQSRTILIPGLAREAGTLNDFPAFQGEEIVPPIAIPGYAGLSQGRGITGPLYQNQFSGDSQYIRGSHTLEFGGALVHTSLFVDGLTGRQVQYSPRQSANFNATSGNGFASYILGLPESAARVFGSTEGDVSGWAYSWYLSDTFRVGRKLTVNIGLRWDYAPPTVNKLGTGTFVWETGQYVFDRTNPITNEPNNIRPGAIEPDRNNFQPRLGLAYQLSSKTVVRTSFGLFHNTFGSNYVQTQQSPRGNWPFAFPQAVAGLNATTPNAIFPSVFPGPAQGSRTPLSCNQCLNVIEESTRTPYVEQWSFSIQRALTRSLMLEAAYFGSHGVKLVGQVIDNIAISPGSGPIRDRQRWPQYAPYVSNGFNIFPSWYHGTSWKLDQRLSRGLTFSLAYTFSKNLDVVDNLSNASLGGAPTSNPVRFQIPSLKGPAGFDVPHILVFSYVYDLPLRTSSKAVNLAVAGWTMSGVASYYSGLPYMLFLNGDVANVGTVAGRSTQYPNLVGNPNDIGERTPDRWFNTAAFASPAQFTFGNVGRNILRTDSLSNWNFSLQKRFHVAEKRHFQFRGEFFNLLNHPSFGYPGGVLGTPQFGKVSNTRNSGRQVQLALKFHF